MKLGKCAAALVVTSFLLTGCQNGSKTVKEDDKFVISSLSKDDKEKNIFADDVFDDIISTASGKSAYFDAALQQLMLITQSLKFKNTTKALMVMMLKNTLNQRYQVVVLNH